MSGNLFHLHLDNCAQCRDQPFNLCPQGEAALTFQVTGEIVNVANRRNPNDIIMAGMPEGSREVIDAMAKSTGPAGELGKIFKTLFG